MSFLLTAAILASYWNSLHVPFTFDDEINIIENQGLQISELSLGNLYDAALSGINKRRIIPNVSFALNYYFFGHNVLTYHLTNILIHVAATLLLYALFLKILTLMQQRDQSSREIHHRTAEIAFWASLLWAVHPLQSNAVTYVVQRMTSLAFFFFILTVLFYIQSRCPSKNSLQKYGSMIGAVVSGLCALASKENAAILPAILLALEFYLIPHAAARSTFTKTACLIIGALLLLLAIAWSFLGFDLISSVLSGYQQRNFTLSERLLTESRVVLLYLTLLLLPLPSRLNISHHIDLSTSLLHPPSTIISIAAIGGMTFLILYFRERNRLLSLALFWFLANLLIESSILPLELIFEHRLYLPSVFLFLFFTHTLFDISARISNVKICRTVLCLLVIGLMACTIQRNTTWQDPLSLWGDVVRKAPENPRGYINLAKTYLSRNDTANFPLAEQYLLTAIKLDNTYSIPYLNLGTLYYKQGKYHQAEQLFLTGLTKRKANPEKFHFNLGRVYKKLADYPRAIHHTKLALTHNYDNLDGYLTIGICYENLGEYEKSMAMYREAEQRGLRSADLFNNWGIAAYKSGDSDLSVKLLEYAVQLDPGHPESHYNLGITYGSLGRFAAARREMAAAKRLRKR